jgi:outer membrane receptor protein involved in Fe transport
MRTFTVRISALLPLLAAAALAQTSPAPKPNSANQNAGDVVELSAFEVSSTANRGYVTTSSLTASRIAVPITELPSTVISINEKLISDTVAVDMRDTFNFVAGANHGNQGTGSQEQNQISLRGYTVGSSQRDGVADRMITPQGGFDYSYIESIEVVKGPSGVLYGSHTPGGVINFISKRPLRTPRTRLSATIGSYNTYRFDGDTSGFFDQGHTWGYRLAGARADTDGPLDFAGEPSGGFKAINPSISYRAKNGLYVWAWAAFVRDAMKRLMLSAHAYQTGPTTGQVLFREAEDSRGNNIFRNFTEVNTDNYELGASKTLELGRLAADVRLLGRRYKLDSSGDRTRAVGTAVDLFLDAAGNVLGTDSRTTSYSSVAANLATIARQQIRFDNVFNQQEGDVYTADVNFKFDLGPTRHRLLAYYSYDKSDSSSANNAYTINSTPKLVALGAQLVGTQTRLQVWPTPAPEMLSLSRETVVTQADTRALNTNTSDNELIGYGAIERLSFLKNRVFLVAGVRKDELQTKSTTFVNSVAQPRITQDDSSTTESYGALVKVYDAERGVVSVYYNDNQTFVPEFTRDTRLGPNLGQRFPNRNASTKEYGAKVDLFDSRVVSTFSIFDTTEDNVLVQFNDQDGSITGIPVNTYRAPVGARKTKGWDLDLNFAPAPGWEFMLAYAKIDSKLDTGIPAQEQPDSTFSSVARYEFLKGNVKGLSLMWMYSYWGSSIMGSRTNWFLPSGDVHTAIIGYRWRKWDARLRIENVFNDLSALPSTFETAVGVTRPRNYRFALSYTF